MRPDVQEPGTQYPLAELDEFLINTAASARCADALTTGELFQQFARPGDKPLKRLMAHSVPPPPG
jgi:hypothetical protein